MMHSIRYPDGLGWLIMGIRHSRYHSQCATHDVELNDSHVVGSGRRPQFHTSHSRHRTRESSLVRQQRAQTGLVHRSSPFQSVTNLHAHAARFGIRTHPHQLTSKLLMHVELTAADHERSNPVQSWLADVFKQAQTRKRLTLGRLLACLTFSTTLISARDLHMTHLLAIAVYTRSILLP